MPYTKLLLERFERYAVITLNRPKANALSQELLREIREAVEELDADRGVRCIVITGAGDRFFSGGADLLSLRKSLGRPNAGDGMLAEGLRTMEAVESCGTPVLAAVNGMALGGGCELSLACHIRIAADTAQFGLPEINLGILPGWGGTHRLPRLIGESRALEWMLTGRMVPADEAYAAGLVCRVAPQAELMDAAKELAATLASKAPVSARSILRTVHGRALEPSHGAALEAQALAEVSSSKDAIEGVTAFLERRAPDYAGE